MYFDAAVVDSLELRTASNPLGWSKLQLLAADREPLATLRAAAFEYETTIFGAHPDEKPMRPLPAARVRLKRAHSLGHDIPSR